MLLLLLAALLLSLSHGMEHSTHDSNEYNSILAVRGDDIKNYRNAPDVVPNLKSLGLRIYGKPDKKTGQRVAEWNPLKHKVNPEELGSYAAGDILIPKLPPKTGRNGLVAETARWRGGVIPFHISGDFNDRELAMIYGAFDIYHDLTCIRFVPWSGFEPDYVSIENTETGCWASVGRIGGKQVANLQSQGCLTKIGTPLHELMHTIGFLHEQNRNDRDSFVQILWENIATGKEENFKKASRSLAMSMIKYDYHSVMHYTNTAFSSNGQPTLSTKVSGIVVGQREGLSRRDVQKIRLMYKCEGTVSFVK